MARRKPLLEKRQLIKSLVGILGLFVAIAILSIFWRLQPAAAARAVLGLAFALVAPGFALSLLLFKEIKPEARVALSLAFSAAELPTAMIALNLLAGVKITEANTLLTAVALTLVPAAVWLYHRRRL